MVTSPLSNKKKITSISSKKVRKIRILNRDANLKHPVLTGFSNQNILLFWDTGNRRILLLRLDIAVAMATRYFVWHVRARFYLFFDSRCFHREWKEKVGEKREKSCRHRRGTWVENEIKFTIDEFGDTIDGDCGIESLESLLVNFYCSCPNRNVERRSLTHP